jgi:hypothetical protein
MRDDDLDRMLKSAAGPARPDGYWEAFPGRVLNRLSQPARAASPWWVWLAPAATLALALVALGFFLGARTRASRQPDGYAALKNPQMLGEMLSLFPHQLRAVVEDGGGVHLVLADHPDVPASPPLWIEVDRGSARRALVTFSGQQVQIGGESVEVLADPQGGITLVGDHLFWSSEARTPQADGVKIRAQALASVE